METHSGLGALQESACERDRRGGDGQHCHGHVVEA